MGFELVQPGKEIWRLFIMIMCLKRSKAKGMDEVLTFKGYHPFTERHLE
jgi:hypothetical protein